VVVVVVEEVITMAVAEVLVVSEMVLTCFLHLDNLTLLSLVLVVLAEKVQKLVIQDQSHLSME
jgi:hypothetical protein